jgi:hypothetical protein
MLTGMAMTQKDAQALDNGLYHLFWKAGGCSAAAVGTLHDGRRWFAPTNWTSKETAGIASTAWRLVDHTARIWRLAPLT